MYAFLYFRRPGPQCSKEQGQFEKLAEKNILITLGT